MADDGGRRPCSLCQHPSRHAIDQALLNGKGLRPIATDFQIGSGTPGTDTFRADHKKVERHRDRCMAEAYRHAQEQSLDDSGMALVDRMHHLDQVVDETLARLREGAVITDANGPMLHPETGEPLKRHNDSAILAAVREARRNVEMRARLAGSLPEGDQDALDQARRLLDSPEARRRVAELEAMLAERNGGAGGV